MTRSASRAGLLHRPHTRYLAAWAAILLGLASWTSAARAEEPGLQIELNKVVGNDSGCIASLVLQNKLGHTLDRFSLDLFVFDREGIIAREVLLDLAPLRNDKTTVASFSLIPSPCEDIGRVLVNNIPACRGDDGTVLDCLASLKVSSRGRIELIK